MGLHLCGITTDGKLWHTSCSMENSAASWSSWEEVKASRGNEQASFSRVACISTDWVSSSTDAALHLVGITQDGRLLQTSRLPQQDWQPFDDLTTRLASQADTFQDVGEDTIGNSGGADLCVIVRTKNGERRILHTSCDSDGVWAPFEDINQPQLAGSPGVFLTVACASSWPRWQVPELHVCGVTEDGKLWHALRCPNVAPVAVPDFWLPFVNVQLLSANAPSSFTSVSCTLDACTLHVCAQAGSDLWHTSRFASNEDDGTPPHWQSVFENIKEAAGNPGSFGSLSCAVGWDDRRRLHVCGVTDDGKLWHSNLPLDAELGWQPFEEVTAAGDPGRFQYICLASDPFGDPVSFGGNPENCPPTRANINSLNLTLQGLHKQLSSTTNPATIAHLNTQIAGCQQKLDPLQRWVEQNC